MSINKTTGANFPSAFRILAAACGILFLTSAVHAVPVIGADVSSIPRDYADPVQISVYGLLGTTATLRLYTDANGNGMVDAEDYAVWTTVITDNGPVWSPNMPGDLNPTSGEIIANVRSFLPFFPYAAGTFIWEVEDSFDGSKASMTFTITQSGTQSVAGYVFEEGTSNPVPGAIVILHPTCDGGEEAYRWYFAISNAAGAFLIQAPAELDCHHRILLAVRPGYLTPILGQHHIVLNGATILSGMNVELTPGQHAVSGYVKYASGVWVGSGIPGVHVFAGDDSETPVVSIAFADETGRYEFLLANGDWFIEAPQDEQLWVHGAVGLRDVEEFVTVTGAPATVADIEFPAANAFISGTLTDALGGPVAGRWMGADRWWPCDPDCFSGAALTDSAGNFTLGVVGPVAPDTNSYSVSTRDPLEGQVAIQRTCDAVSAGSNITGANITHFYPNRTISGQITDAAGNPVENMCVHAWMSGMSCTYYAAETETDCNGNYVLPAADGNWYVNVYVEDFAVIYRGLPDVQIQQPVTVSGGNVTGVNFVLGVPSFSGRVVDKLGNGTSAEVRAYRVSDGGLEASVFNDPTTGDFTIEVPNGDYRLDIHPQSLSVTGPTEVRNVTVLGATQAEFDFRVFDQNTLQLTGLEPRVGREYRDYVPAGAPIHIMGENLTGGAFFDIRFSDGLGGFVVGNDTVADTARGLLLTRVPAGAVTGEMRIHDGANVSPPVPFTVMPGTHDVGVHVVSGHVTDGVNPVAGVTVALFWQNPAVCSDDEDFFQDYAVTDASGNYSLTHPGGHGELLFFPPTSGTFAPAVDSFFDVFTDITINKTLSPGYAVSLRVVDDAIPANPVPNARIQAESDAFDLRITDANGEATLYLPAGDYEFEITGPVLSRLEGQEENVTLSGPVNFGDVPLYRGAFLGGRAAKQDGTPVPGTEVEAWSNMAPYETFFLTATGFDGVYHGAIPFSASANLRVSGPTDNLAHFQTNAAVTGNDRILYPSHVLPPAGFIAGVIRDAATLAPLGDIALHTHDDDGGPYPSASGSGWARSCADGAYRMKVPVGSHYLHINAGTSNNSSYMEEWFNDAFCSSEADSLQVNEGATVTANIYLDPSGSVSGVVMGDGQPLAGVQICASGASLATCNVCTWTDTNGNYTLSLPAGADYRIQANAWQYGYGYQCYDKYDGCWAYTPVSVSVGVNTPNIDFIFGCSSVSTILFENAESGSPGWTVSGLWHLNSAPTCSPSSYSGSWSWHYAKSDGSCSYDTGAANAGALRSPVMTNVGANAVLSYWFRRQTDNNCGATDRSFVRIWVNGAGPYQVWEECDNSNQWMKRRFDLSGFYSPGDSIQVGFVFNTVDASANNYLGWMIDDVRVFYCLSQPCDPLPAPTLLSVDGQNCGGSIAVNTATPTLVWSDVWGETGYEWEIYDGPNCTGAFVAGGSAGAGVVSVSPSLADGTYSWRVRALGDGVAYCNSIWTCGCPFTVDTGGSGAPPEVSGKASPYPLLVEWNGSNVVLTFEHSGAQGVFYNVYQGAPGSYEPLVKTCFIEPMTDPNFTDNGDGTGSYSFAPAAADALWFLVSASNANGESPLGYDSDETEITPTNVCGATP